MAMREMNGCPSLPEPKPRQTFQRQDILVESAIEWWPYMGDLTVINTQTNGGCAYKTYSDFVFSAPNR